MRTLIYLVILFIVGLVILQAVENQLTLREAGTAALLIALFAYAARDANQESLP